MGITGLLQALNSISKKKHLSEFKGKKISIDGYVILYKGACKCGRKLILEEPVPRLYSYCMNFISQFQKYGITPIVVFDGSDILMKSNTNEKRNKQRKKNKTEALALLQRGEVEKANKKFCAAIEITPEIAEGFIYKLKEKGIEIIVAPYEADVQLAYLSKIGYCDCVYSVDSDLVVYGTKIFLHRYDPSSASVEQILSKDIWTIGCIKNNKESDQNKKQSGSSNNNNNLGGLLKKQKKKRRSTKVEFDFRSWDYPKFIQMCILSGCDYLDSIKGIGLKKAYVLLTKYETIEQVFQMLRYDSKLNVPFNYEQNFKKSFLTFLHQVVYDPIQQKVKHFREYDQSISLDEDITQNDYKYEFLGKMIKPEIAKGIANGVLHPSTFLRFDHQKILKFMGLSKFKIHKNKQTNYTKNTITNNDNNNEYKNNNNYNNNKNNKTTTSNDSYHNNNNNTKQTNYINNSPNNQQISDFLTILDPQEEISDYQNENLTLTNKNFNKGDETGNTKNQVDTQELKNKKNEIKNPNNNFMVQKKIVYINPSLMNEVEFKVNNDDKYFNTNDFFNQEETNTLNEHPNHITNQNKDNNYYTDLKTMRGNRSLIPQTQQNNSNSFGLINSKPITFFSKTTNIEKKIKQTNEFLKQKQIFGNNEIFKKQPLLHNITDHNPFDSKKKRKAPLLDPKLNERFKYIQSNSQYEGVLKNNLQSENSDQFHSNSNNINSNKLINNDKKIKLISIPKTPIKTPKKIPTLNSNPFSAPPNLQNKNKSQRAMNLHNKCLTDKKIRKNLFKSFQNTLNSENLKSRFNSIEQNQKEKEIFLNINSNNLKTHLPIQSTPKSTSKSKSTSTSTPVSTSFLSPQSFLSPSPQHRLDNKKNKDNSTIFNKISSAKRLTFSPRKNSNLQQKNRRSPLINSKTKKRRFNSKKLFKDNEKVLSPSSKNRNYLELGKHSNYQKNTSINKNKYSTALPKRKNSFANLKFLKRFQEETDKN
ncbi:exonuclease 1 [Anaeramoeba flamelloides]|uniref:Exonuclease 1 n=1 Tax=Anaeramoeba flamelloides TaxID=1746091 RepID=A0ABQ8Y9M9_9EUKA|nr:exonuclease 1 [Anaeramoeba flamelloides]